MVLHAVLCVNKATKSYRDRGRLAEEPRKALENFVDERTLLVAVRVKDVGDLLQSLLHMLRAMVAEERERNAHQDGFRLLLLVLVPLRMDRRSDGELGLHDLVEVLEGILRFPVVFDRLLLAHRR